MMSMIGHEPWIVTSSKKSYQIGAFMELVFEPTAELSVIRFAMMLIWRHSNESYYLDVVQDINIWNVSLLNRFKTMYIYYSVWYIISIMLINCVPYAQNNHSFRYIKIWL